MCGSPTVALWWSCSVQSESSRTDLVPKEALLPRGLNKGGRLAHCVRLPHRYGALRQSWVSASITNPPASRGFPVVDESIRLNRLAQARHDLSEISGRITELAAQIPEPLTSVAEALRSLSPDQQEALRMHRTEALEVIAQQIVEEQRQLTQLTTEQQDAKAEWMSLVERGDFARMSELGPTMNRLNDELGQRRVALEELKALQEALITPSDPADSSATAR